MTDATASLRSLSDEEIAARYATAGEAAGETLLRELARRDRKAEQTRRDTARWAAVYEEWHLFAHAQYLAAEAETRGYLLSREGAAAGIDPWSLWAGSSSRAERLASEELRNFWLVSPRLTVSAYREQIRRADRQEREQYA